MCVGGPTLPQPSPRTVVLLLRNTTRIQGLLLLSPHFLWYLFFIFQAVTKCHEAWSSPFWTCAMSSQLCEGWIVLHEEHPWATGRREKILQAWLTSDRVSSEAVNVDIRVLVTVLVGSFILHLSEGCVYFCLLWLFYIILTHSQQMYLYSIAYYIDRIY